MQPKWMDFATAELGQKETAGAANNPRVVEYLKSAKGETLPDSVPWCAGFVGWCLNMAGLPDSDSLMARSYLRYGTALKEPKFGCIAVYSRGTPPSGHVGFWVGEDGEKDIIRGGNQSDAVNDSPQSKARALGYRWPPEPADKPLRPIPEATHVEHRRLPWWRVLINAILLMWRRK
jgi:uncharacterized protein (TIGR02594 family)